MKKKYPDNIVYDYTLEKFDANTKPYPTSLGGQKFEPIKVDKSSIISANNYFKTRLDELKEEYKKLIEDYNWTKLVYESKYSFQPNVGEKYYLYENKNKELFLSLIKPNEWNQPYVGTFKLKNNGKWEKI
mgnify:FL=1|jgi:hypothetical protein|tara:strand:+ start:1290 stop:1679 length:390 start_codon:yes stop_codon:yes gene_type:complete